MTRILGLFCAAVSLYAQGTLADYQRAHDLEANARIGKSDRFWYPRSVKGGTEFVLVDAARGAKRLAFDVTTAWPPPCRPTRR